MNREQAIRAVADKIGLSGPFTNNLVDAMAAVGVLKLDEEPQGWGPTVMVPAVSIFDPSNPLEAKTDDQEKGQHGFDHEAGSRRDRERGVAPRTRL